MPAIQARDNIETMAAVTSSGKIIEMLKRAATANDKNSFAYLWASPAFKYTIIILLVVIVVVPAFLIWRRQQARKRERLAMGLPA
jgi:hypothetical protein